MKLTDTEIRVLRSLHLRGCMGKCGSLTAKQRGQILTNLISYGYLTERMNLTRAGINASTPFKNQYANE